MNFFHSQLYCIGSFFNGFFIAIQTFPIISIWIVKIGSRHSDVHLAGRDCSWPRMCGPQSKTWPVSLTISDHMSCEENISYPIHPWTMCTVQMHVSGGYTIGIVMSRGNLRQGASWRVSARGWFIGTTALRTRCHWKKIRDWLIIPDNLLVLRLWIGQISIGLVWPLGLE